MANVGRSTPVASAAAVSCFLYHAGEARAVYLLIYMVPFLFGVFRLRTRELALVAVFMVGCYCGVVLLLSVNRPPQVDARLELLRIAVESGASDLHLKVGSYPMMRIQGTLRPASEEKRLDHEDMVAIAATVLPATHREKFLEHHEVDLAYGVPGLGRFRCNAFQQRGTVGMVFRVIPMRVGTIEELALPAVLRTIAAEERGLVLVTGTTGSGKSTTLAAMIDYLNTNDALHILTVEDPIEFLHQQKKSRISQREIGRDTASFAIALKSALRQDPDVILVGEMRDIETLDIALKAAEGTARQFATYLRSAMQRTLMARIGYLFARDAFKALKDKMDPNKSNGGVFLGLNGIVVKSHGGTNAEGFAYAVDVGYDMVRYDLLTKINQTLDREAGALVKTPLDFAISALRATNASIMVAAPVVQALRTTLGMPLYYGMARHFLS